MSPGGTHVVKLGGSLLDLPDLRDRVQEWGADPLAAKTVFVVGGGRAADTVRHLDATHGLGESIGHELAVAAMAINARAFAALMHWRIINDPAEAKPGAAVIDPVAALAALEETGVTFPRRWSFTSDSIAALIGRAAKAERLSLLKSTLPDAPIDVAQAAANGLVDDDFPTFSEGIERIVAFNLRTTPAQAMRLR